ncbi:MAG: dihydrofolate reductase [Burkholderiales bacterium]
MSRIVLIAAVAANGVIGRDNDLPWRLPEDLKFFRATTMGHPVLMGRRNWDSIPAKFRPLPGRRNLVLTRDVQWHAEGAEPVHSLDEALARTADAPTLFVIGGADIFRLTLPLADELILTELDSAVDGDVRFPAWDRSAYAVASREAFPASEAGALSYHRTVYRRPQH